MNNTVTRHESAGAEQSAGGAVMVAHKIYTMPKVCTLMSRLDASIIKISVPFGPFAATCRAFSEFLSSFTVSASGLSTLFRI